MTTLNELLNIKEQLKILAKKTTPLNPNLLKNRVNQFLDNLEA